MSSRLTRLILLPLLAAIAVAAAGLSTAPTANAANYYYCGVDKSPGSFCPLTSQLPARHTYYHNYTTDNGSSCGGHRMLAYVAYTSSNASSPKYDYNSNTCNVGDYSFASNTELLRIYGAHYGPNVVRFTGNATY